MDNYRNSRGWGGEGYDDDKDPPERKFQGVGVYNKSALRGGYGYFFELHLNCKILRKQLEHSREDVGRNTRLRIVFICVISFQTELSKMVKNLSMF